jgi:hypothetical protein
MEDAKGCTSSLIYNSNYPTTYFTYFVGQCI